ncbi:MAG: hypothetical protein GX786_04295 [Clostridiales bacterium]|nr:hypothetical protein [Clostridiales bacterium]
MAVASLVLGIISILFAIFGTGFQWVGTILGIIFGAKGKNDPQNAGLAKAGFVCSIIGKILSLLLFIACVACVGGGLGILGAVSSY